MEWTKAHDKAQWPLYSRGSVNRTCDSMWTNLHQVMLLLNLILSYGQTCSLGARKERPLVLLQARNSIRLENFPDLCCSIFSREPFPYLGATKTEPIHSSSVCLAQTTHFVTLLLSHIREPGPGETGLAWEIPMATWLNSRAVFITILSTFLGGKYEEREKPTIWIKSSKIFDTDYLWLSHQK